MTHTRGFCPFDVMTLRQRRLQLDSECIWQHG